MSRPPLTGEVVGIPLNLRLRVGEDDDLIAFFGRVPARRRPAAIKAALRAGGIAVADDAEQEDDDLGELDGLVFA